MQVKGIDAYNMGVRDVNGNIIHTPIDWAKVKQTENGAFTILKATLGNGMDWSFLANYAECKKVGMAIGAYHWLYANTVAKAHQEAQFFINAVKGKQFEYPIMLDIEDDPDCPTLGCLDKELLTDIVIAWLTDVQKAGYYVMWYANPDWRKNHLNMARLAAFDSMLACYDGNTPDTANYSADCGIWQYSSKGTLDGISNHYVDLDVAYKDYPGAIKSAGLNGWGKAEPVAAPATSNSAVSKPVAVASVKKPNGMGQYGPNPTLKFSGKYRQTIVYLQQHLGVKADGIAGPITYAACIKYTIRLHDKGPITLWLEQYLNGLGFHCGAADGAADADTMAGIARFQKAHGLGQGYLGGTDWYYILEL